MSVKTKFRVGITLGDVNGIGPEVALKAVYGRRWPAGTQFVFIGHPKVLAQQARRFGLREPPAASLADPPSGRAICWAPAHLPLRWQPGKLDPAASAAAGEWILAGVDACLRGQLDALVTAPISKEGFHRAGINVPGHTEMLAELCGATRVGMMLFGGPLRVVLATRHLPLKDVPAALTPAVVEEAIDLTAKALPWLGARRARIGVCGLNPHAGEGGDLGTEDDAVIRPVVERLRKRGLRVAGPLPGDTVFHQAAAGDYDAVVAMYHDQGLAPLKLIAFDSGVNLTLGLPIVRTSPDHGTAFALAGKNRANPASMAEALKWAIALAGRRNPWSQSGDQ
ncbi:MAG TPA: 4-hydroxythreonine-4-phosphate dehydrogenase PdxA [Kiritimatiellia bacterium]|nr:4-hydroxythreonine-4-phosphate dehydrogenase PdxA [Kiritimatiellia bacterium]